jgi:hypothetical protein
MTCSNNNIGYRTLTMTNNNLSSIIVIVQIIKSKVAEH